MNEIEQEAAAQMEQAGWNVRGSKTINGLNTLSGGKVGLRGKRLRELQKIAVAMGYDIRVPKSIDKSQRDLTKDEIIVLLEGAKYTPQMKPLTGQASYEHWEWIGLKQETKARGITADPEWDKGQYIAALRQNDAEKNEVYQRALNKAS